MNNNFSKLNPVALGGTLALIDIVLHPLFHLWVAIAPRTYEKLMNIFVAGLQLQVTDFDLAWGHLIIGTLLEATVFGLLGFIAAKLYNYLNSKI